jgi:hypothetical protein
MKVVVTICLALILGFSAVAQEKKDPPKYKNLKMSRLKIEDEGYLRNDKGITEAFVVEEVIDDGSVRVGMAETRTLQFVFKMDTKNLADGSVIEPSGVWKVTRKEKRGTSTLFVLEKIAKK